MRLTAILLSICSLQIAARTVSQTVTFTGKNVQLESVFYAIERQTGYFVVYEDGLLEKAIPVTIDFHNAELKEFLKAVLQNQPFGFSIKKTTIVIEKKSITFPFLAVAPSPPPVVKGRVVNEKGDPVAGVSVKVKSSENGVSTNVNGEFSLYNVGEKETLVFSGANIETYEMRVISRSDLLVGVKVKVSKLDEVQVIAYGTTTQRYNVGSVTKVSAAEIEKQPVSNLLAALQGRVPGMVINQTSGVPGSSFTVEIRGRSSLDPSISRNDPLFVIDGVPFEPGVIPSSQISSAANKPTNNDQGGLSPLNTISPSDIESIEVLKDADATAIYGSRGANGIVLITTKKGRPGKTNISFNVNYGLSKVSRTMDMLNTRQYVAMRKEAFLKDGIGMTASNAPDIILWDTTRYTDFKKILIGGTAHTANAQLGVSGGNANTNFLIGGSFHKETNIYSNQLNDQVSSVHLNINHFSNDRKLNIALLATYGSDNNKLISNDLTQYVNMAPNILLKDANGNLNWSESGVPYSGFGNGTTNPLSLLLRRYNSINDNLTANFRISYKIFKDLILKTGFGYNVFLTDETSVYPKASVDPFENTSPSSQFANSNSKNWIVEPQLEYARIIFGGSLNFLLGGTWQNRVSESSYISARNYSSDLLLNSIEAAGDLYATNTYDQYRYLAFFGRLNYIWKEKYVLNMTGRRDGSSRFGPDKRFANFGAGGAGWIFSKESFFRLAKGIISFGKLRASYGVTGNDQISNYKYLDLWAPGGSYEDVPSLVPTSLFNPAYNWEKTKKTEVAVELGLFKDRIYITSAYYQNRSSNQLINYQLPYQAGFASITRNLPALVQNSGVEFVITSKNIISKKFSWSSALNFSVPKNKLISFPDLENSSYVNDFKEGSSLNLSRGYNYLGVDPQTGAYTVEDIDKDGSITGKDYLLWDDLNPNFYGGFDNTFSLKGFSLDIFFEFRKQKGKNYLENIGNFHPGKPINQPVLVLNHWEKEGDIVPVQRYSSRSGGPVGFGSFYMRTSNGIYSDASFVRLKNISLSYDMPLSAISKIGVQNLKIYLHAQNLFVISKYLGSDPEVQDYYRLPPLKTIVAGLQLNF